MLAGSDRYSVDDRIRMSVETNLVLVDVIFELG